MNILIINCGSSTMKYQLINMDAKYKTVLASGIAERIGYEQTGVLTYIPKGGEKIMLPSPLATHKTAVKAMLDMLVDEKYGVISSLNEITAVGHRIVHGGEKYSESVILNDQIIEDLEGLVQLAPLHAKAGLMGIYACKKVLPDAPQAAVFDTAFHRSIPEYAYIYPIPYEYYEKYKIRKYGFHGTSHHYVSMRAAAILKRDDLKIITCHLGSGSSCAAIKNGKCLETTMGFTPLDGLTMGTRCGSIDLEIVMFLCKNEQLTLDEVETILNKRSGVFGISGLSSDFRDLEKASAEGHRRAKLAIDIFNYDVMTTIGEYTAVLGGLDCIVFTAGIGENSVSVRKAILKGLEYMGIKIDDEQNAKKGQELIISTPDSKVKVLVIPTNEELMIALETEKLMGASPALISR